MTSKNTKTYEDKYENTLTVKKCEKCIEIMISESCEGRHNLTGHSLSTDKSLALRDYLNEAYPQWISVDDDMPDIDTEVLTYRHSFKNGDLYIHCVHTEAGFIDYRSGLLIKEPTHWQPLPEPPKGKGEDDA